MIRNTGQFTTTDYELSKRIPTSARPKFLGIFMKDQKIPDKVGTAIVNLNNSNQSGSHWVGIMRTPNGTPFNYYFDSYGQEVPETTLKQLKSTGKSVKHADNVLQEINASTCGWYTLYWIDVMSKAVNACKDKNNLTKCLDKAYYDFVYKKFNPNNQEANERKIKKHFHLR